MIQKSIFIGALLLALFAQRATAGDRILDGRWDEAKIDAVLEKTLRLHLKSDTSVLSAGEHLALRKLLRVGELFHEIYLDQHHPQALQAQRAIRDLSRVAAEPQLMRKLSDVFRLMKGPIATTLENERVSFLGVSAETLGKNVYPAGADRGVLDGLFAASPLLKDELLQPRAVVRSATQAAGDLAKLEGYPAIELLHPGLRARLERAAAAPDEVPYYALPYSVAYAERITEAFTLLMEAADALEADDDAFARFLRLRARDLLSDDYDAGDATWVTAEFTGNLNAELGSYETYDDALYGVKSFFAASILLRDRVKSIELTGSIGDLQGIEDALPYEAHKRVRTRIPVGVYEVLADFGQSRGTNTATILPNEGQVSRQFGRTILIRSNILMNPQIFELTQASFRAATVDEHHDDLTPEGGFYRTLWHEIGHYLGPDQTKDGEDLDTALQDTADLIEEMKSDLVSLFASQYLHDHGVHDARRLRDIQAGGIRRVIQNAKPRRSQAYQTMQLIQWNWFLDRGLLSFENDRLRIHHDRYAATVESLLAAVLELQRNGDRAEANAFVDRWTTWNEELHEVIAQRLRDQEEYRYRLVSYEALGESAADEPGR
jgi:hypothetical protein